MDGPREELAFLSASLRRSINGVNGAIESGAEPGQLRGTHFNEYLKVATRAIEERLNGLSERAATSEDPEDIGAISRSVRLLRQSILFLLPLIGSAGDRATRPRLSLVYFLEEAAEDLVRAKADLVIRVASDYNLSIAGLEGPFRELLRPLGVEPPDGPTPLLIKHPVVEADRVLLHPLFVHELGHEVLRRRGLRDAVVSKHPDAAALGQLFEETVRLVQLEHSTSGRATSQEEIEATVRSMLTGWLDELLCDLIATGYAGPSFLFAATAFLFVSPRTEGSATHPPSSLRIRLILDYLRELGWLDLLSTRLPNLLSWLQWLATPQPVREGDHLRSFAHQVVGDLEVEMRTAVTGDLAMSILRRAQYEVVSDDLDSLLEHGIPPVQLDNGGAAGRREIITACWLHSLVAAGDTAASVAAALADSPQQSFYAKAMEMSHVLERWRKA